MSASDQTIPPYAQALQDDLNAILQAADKYSLDPAYLGTAMTACSAALTMISDGDLVLPAGHRPRVTPVTGVLGAGEQFIGDGGSAKMKSGYGITEGALVSLGSSVILALKVDGEPALTHLPSSEASRVGAVKLKKLFMGIRGVEFLHTNEDPEESLGRVLLLLPIEVSGGLDATWQQQVLAGLRG